MIMHALLDNFVIMYILSVKLSESFIISLSKKSVKSEKKNN